MTSPGTALASSSPSRTTPRPGLHARILNEFALPTYYSLRGRPYPRIRRQVEQMQWWSPAQLEEYRFNEFRKLLRIAFDSVPFYQQKYAEAGVRFEDIQSTADIRRLPILERDDLRDRSDDLVNRAFTGKLIPHATGGSSGKPTRFLITTESYDWRTAVTNRSYEWAGCILGEPTVLLWGAPTSKPSLKKKIKLSLFNRFRNQYVIDTLFHQGDGFWEQAIDVINRVKPTSIVAYTSNIERLCQAVSNTGRSIPSVKSVLAAAEAVYPALYDTVRNTLHADLFNTYGSREFMSLAVECDRHNGLHVNCENVFIENTEGGSGFSDLLITDLHNYGMPFIRYRIGDCAAIDMTPCSCGRGNYRLSSVEGRSTDLLRTTTGQLVSGLVVPHVMKDLPEVSDYQVEQTSLNALEVRLVLTKELSPANREHLETKLRQALGQDLRITVVRVNEIPLRASGKRRIVIGLGT